MILLDLSKMCGLFLDLLLVLSAPLSFRRKIRIYKRRSEQQQYIILLTHTRTCVFGRIGKQKIRRKILHRHIHTKNERIVRTGLAIESALR